MAELPRKQGVRAYIAERLYILYLAYFKPFTLAHLLRDELRPYSSFFRVRTGFSSNPRLQRYDRHIRLLSATLPLLVIPPVGLLYMLLTREQFDWLHSGLLVLGWATSLQVSALFRRGLFVRTALLRVFWLTGLALLQSTLAVPAHSVAGEVAFAVAGIVAGSVAGGVAGGIARGMVAGMAVGMAFGFAVSIDGGVVIGIATGIAFSMAWMLGTLRANFWLPEFFWMCILYILSRKGNKARWLAYIPPRFDELIIIPLPFLKRLLLETYQENPAATQRTVDYLITSTNQLKVAANVMKGIALEELSNCQTTGNIIAVADHLAWIPSPPPKIIGSLLPQFLEISLGVRAALEGSSFSRQYQELEKPISGLRHLQKGSIAFEVGAWQATIYGRIADRWLSILETARQNLEEQAHLFREIPQEYIAGPALDPESAGGRFKGRQDLFREIENMVLSPQPPALLLYGGPRAGKTSVLKYLPRHLGPDLVPLLIDVQGIAAATTLVGIAEGLADQIVKAARQSRNLNLPPPDAYKLSRDPFPALQKWLEQLEQLAMGKRFLLCLDEFGRLSEFIEATGSRVPLNFLRNILQHHPQWMILFSGSHPLSELAEYWSDYLINTQTLRVSFLEEQDARELIVRPVEGFPDIYEAEAIDTIISLTRCQPYLLQLMCYVLIEQLNQEQRMAQQVSQEQRRVTSRDIQMVIPKAFDKGAMYFKEFWEHSLTPEERNLLLRLGRTSLERTSHGSSPRLMRSILRHAFRGDKNREAVLQKLIQKEIVEKTENDYRFQVPLTRIFVEREIMKEL